jgi:hypothetical protein
LADEGDLADVAVIGEREAESPVLALVQLSRADARNRST